MRTKSLPTVSDGPPRLLASLGEGQQILGIGRTTIYDLIARGEIEVVHVGRRTLVVLSSLEQYVERLRAGRQSTTPAP